MCLMCEHYLAICKEPECVAAADAYDVFESRSGWTGVLWRGYREPCDHIKAEYPDWADDMYDDDE